MKEKKAELKAFAKSIYRTMTDLIKERLSELNIQKSNFSKELIDFSYKKGLSFKNNSFFSYNGFVKSIANTWFSRLIVLKALKVNGIDSSLDNLEDLKDLTEFLLNLKHISPNLFNPNDIANLVFPINHDLIVGVQNLADEPFYSDSIIETLSTLYEAFSSDYKTQVYNELKGRNKIDATTLPTVTQLFTPSYIVKYLVQNTVGRLWINHLLAIFSIFNEENLIDQFKLNYYIPTQYDLEGYSKETIDYFKNLNLEDLTVLDPAMGTGSILSYTFDLLLQFYKSEGYDDNEAVIKILENNLYGFEIDNDVFRLSEIGLKIKAFKYNKDIFNLDLKLNFYCFDNLELDFEFIEENFGQSLIFKERSKAQKQLQSLLKDFEYAKLLGSLIKPKDYNFSLIKNYIHDYNWSDTNKELLSGLANKLIKLVEVTELLRKQYDVVLTNPPYFSNRNFNSILKKYLKQNYKNNSRDLYTAFIKQCLNLTKDSSYCGMVTMNSWLFLKYNKPLREEVLDNTIINMIHLGTNAFEDIHGEVVQTVAFVIQKENLKDFKGSYLRLLDVEDKEKGVKDKVNLIHINSDNYHFIPESPIAYWATNKIIEHFRDDIKLEEIAASKQGLATTDNKRFLRQWTEIEIDKINFNASSTADAQASGFRWFPYNKGGSFRKWYGNDQFVVDYFDDGKEIKQNVLRKYPYLKNTQFVVKNTDYYFKPSITWSLINTGIPSFRLKDPGYIFDVAGMSVFTDHNELYLLGLLNSVVIQKFLEIIAPTINYQCGDIAQIPIIIDNDKVGEIEALVKENIEISKEDWDEDELSWNFKRSPLLNSGLSLKEAVAELKSKQESRFNRLKENEEKLNKIFLQIYNLESEYSFEVNDNDISVKRLTTEEIIKDFLSYFTGVLFGRFSLDEDGVVLTSSINHFKSNRTIEPVIDNFVPVQSCGIDIINYLEDFIKKVFPTDNINDDLDFIATSLTKKSGNDSREIIRNYFKSDFYRDHLKKYNKRPIYLQLSITGSSIPTGFLYYHRFNESNFEPAIKFYKQSIMNIQDELKKVLSKKHSKTKMKKLETVLRNLNQRINDLESLGKVNLNYDDGVDTNLKKIQTTTEGNLLKILR